jgi:hypothetical protein
VDRQHFLPLGVAELFQRVDDLDAGEVIPAIVAFVQ